MNFTKFMNQALPAIVDELNDNPSVGLQKIEPEGARPHYVAKDQEFSNLYDYTLAFMLKEKIIDGFDGVMKHLSYLRLAKDLADNKKVANIQEKR